ncbi:hypothetical protein SAMN04488137_4545 [Fictibacillus solisalsi]|uniref:Uncharacterized protein n=1 Tax=Fictibacillus solisalsi TaxID=459525 RepID=A0A1H0BLG5_9BACL|nr:hypothetical protein [Fictibacillus solisalsi]SDN46385.1 hypothetical protein SAMN04488137_4545 [Fictibacillus solisalsi]
MARSIDVIVSTPKGYTVKKVSDKMLRQDIEKFEENFPDGVYTLPTDTEKPRLKVRALAEYCMKHGKEPEELSEEEKKQFYEH